MSGLATLLIAAAAFAAGQDHAMHEMPGMTHKAPVSRPPARPAVQASPHHVPAADHGAHDIRSAPPAAGEEQQGTDLPPGSATAPPPPMPTYADRYWDGAEMARSRDIMMRRDGGGRTFAQLVFNLAEVQVQRGRDGYRWDGEGWFGRDVDRLVMKTEGEGAFRGGVEHAEVQLLYARAIGPYFNLQAGVRQDFGADPHRTYASVGVEGLAPYWFDVEATAFVSTEGDVLGRVEAYYDQRLTQRLILQPRIELNLAAQDVRATGLGAGLTSAEAGLRLRYEIRREFAPYVGVSWDRQLGGTADRTRARGEAVGGFAGVAGVRAWF